MHIWEACRATSAALTFFDPIVVDGLKYSDGGLIYNNPVQLVHGEASEVFPDREQLIVSLGTGVSKIVRWEPRLLTIAHDLANLATETEKTADDFFRRDGAKAAKAGRYFRFNVPGLGDIGLDESKQLHDIETLAEHYLDTPEEGLKVQSCAERLLAGVYDPFENLVVPEVARIRDSSLEAKPLQDRFQKLREDK